MAIAAVPDYLGKDFSKASPGLRFGMYLPLWGIDSHSKELLWSTFDHNYRIAGRDREERRFKDENKVAAFKQACKPGDSDKLLMQSLRARQVALAARVPEDQLLHLDAVAVAPFATGLGNEHPLENGFAFLNPYGLPYLAGSGVKGVLRKAAGELADGLFGGSGGWTAEAIGALFGCASSNEDDAGGQRGALIIWDVLPEIMGDSLKVEIMTPHQSHYLQGSESPHESGKLTPINFLSVPPKSKFDFIVQCDLPFLARVAPELANGGKWKTLAQAAMMHAFDWCGFGAKTAVGYGAMQLDPEAAARRENAAEAARQEAAAEEAARKRDAELAAMSPAEREIQKVLDERVDPNLKDIAALMTALKKDRWQDELKQQIAVKLRERMQAAKQWKETTQAKKPEKDTDYQNTLLIQRWIAGS